MRVEIDANWDRVGEELTVFSKTEQSCEYQKVKFGPPVCAVSLLKLVFCPCWAGNVVVGAPAILRS